jgi:hypothetical protein
VFPFECSERSCKEEVLSQMAERLNTAVCSFDPSSPMISAFEIHEWLHEVLRIPEQKVSIVQTGAIKRQVYIKFTDQISLHVPIRDTNGIKKVNPSCYRPGMAQRVPGS